MVPEAVRSVKTKNHRECRLELRVAAEHNQVLGMIQDRGNRNGMGIIMSYETLTQTET